MLRTICTILVGSLSMIALGGLAALISLIYPGSFMTMRLGKLWSRLILGCAGIRLEVRGAEHIDAHAPRVYAANHQSMVDIWVTLLLLPVSTVYVAKQSLFRIPFIGWSMRASGFIAIDRGNRERAIGSLRRAAERVRGGRSVCLFPEGTRSRDARLARFKKGGFHLAQRADVPLVPVVISGSWRTLRPGSMRIRPGVVTVEFAPPIDPGAFTGAGLAPLIEAVHEAIASRLERAANRPAASA